MPKRRPKILFIDSDEAMVFSIQGYLGSYTDCLGATSYEEAISLLEQEEGIALVIADIMMPGRDGFDILMWLRENRPKVKVVMTTAYGSPSVRSLAKQKGAVMYLEKPLDLKRLMDTVRVILEHKGFSVSIKDMEFTDLLQFLSFAGKAVRVQVTNTLGEEGEIGLEGDTVLWVRTRSRTGEDAFFEILRWEGGGFEMQPLGEEEIDSERMTVSLSYLLLEGTKRNDEARLSERGGTAAQGKNEGPAGVNKGTAKVNELGAVLEALKGAVPDFIAAEVVGIDDGILISAISVDPLFDPDVAAAYYAEVIKTNEKAIGALEKGQAIEEVLLTTDAFYLLVRILPNTRFFVGLAITRKGNVGMARMVMKKYEDRFTEALSVD